MLALAFGTIPSVALEPVPLSEAVSGFFYPIFYSLVLCWVLIPVRYLSQHVMWRATERLLA